MYPLFSSDFKGTWIFPLIFEKHKHQISWKFVPWVSACSIRMESRADRQTDTEAKLIVAFHNFVNSPKSSVHT